MEADKPDGNEEKWTILRVLQLLRSEFRTVTLPWLLFIVVIGIYTATLFFAVNSQLFRLIFPFKTSLEITSGETIFTYDPDETYMLFVKIKPYYAYSVVFVGFTDPDTKEILFEQSLGLVSIAESTSERSTFIPHSSSSSCPSFQNVEGSMSYRVVFFYGNRPNANAECHAYPASIQVQDNIMVILSLITS